MPSRLFTDDEEYEIGEEYLSGTSARALARKYGTGHRVICEGLARQGIEQRSPSERNRLYQVNHNAFDKIDCEEKAYWYGFLFADGCVSRNKTLSIELSPRDRNHLYKLKEFLMCESPIKNSESSMGYPTIRFNTTSRRLAARLMELGITKGRRNSDIWTYECPERLWNHWMRGYFDGDGTSGKRPSLGFMGRYDLLQIIRRVLYVEADRNPHLKIMKHTTSRIYYLIYSGRYNARAVAEYLYRDATIWLERKRERIDVWPDRKERMRNSVTGRYE